MDTSDGIKQISWFIRITKSFSTYFAIVRCIAPVILGLGCAQGAFGVVSYGGARTDAYSFIPEIALVSASCILLVGMATFGRHKTHLPSSAITTLTVTGVILQLVSAGILALLHSANLDLFEIILVCCACEIFGSILVITHWLRTIRSLPITVIVVTAFSGMMVGELLCSAFVLLPTFIAYALVGVGALLQIVLMRCKIASEKLTFVLEDTTPEKSLTKPTYLSIARQQGYNSRFLMSCALAVIVTSITGSLLWGFSCGISGEVNSIERLIAGVFTITLLAEKARREANPNNEGVLSTWNWLIALSMLALFTYAALPSIPTAGLCFLVAFNDIATAYAWCIIVAFMEKGAFDSHGYALGGMIAFFLPGALIRTASLVFVADISPLENGHFPYDTLVTAAVGVLVVFPAIIVLESVTVTQRKETAYAQKTVATLLRSVGLSDKAQVQAPTDIRKVLLQAAIDDMKDAFMLSERECEVLTLYVLGLTQSKIAEQLHISPNTAHSHITRIYTKTDLHSRQELIDYLDTHSHPSAIQET